MRQLRPVCLSPDPASRTSYVAGEIAQCDFWFPRIQLPAGFGQARTARHLPVPTMVTVLTSEAESQSDENRHDQLQMI